MTPAAGLAPLLATALVVYTLVLFAIALWSRGRIRNSEDYLVAGRRLPFGLASATLFATWFGAGTLLASADEVRRSGLRAAALDPWGAGVCLLLAGAFLARPLWRLKLLTVPDFFRRRFGPRAETLAALLLIPGYFGWIAAQFVALGSMLELFFGLDPALGIFLVAAVGTGYTLIGGMWSVTLTDALQLALLGVGLALLCAGVLAELGGPLAGVARVVREVPEAHLQPIPLDGLAPLFAWIGLFCAGALGNLPGQDLLQRVFAARSADVARRACFAAGTAYLLVGAAPLFLGLASLLLAPDAPDRAILPALAGLFLEPWLAVVFALTVMSAVLSTIDSAILAPASVLSQNLLRRTPLGRRESLRLDELSVLAVAGASLVVALLGEDAYSLLEGAYEIGLVSLLVPLAFGLRSRRGGEAAALCAMALGTGAWLAHGMLGWESFGGPGLAAALVPLPTGLACAALAAGAYVLAPGRGPGSDGDSSGAQGC